MKYLNSIGETEVNRLSPHAKDKSHLSAKGIRIIGKMVVDLIAAKIPSSRKAFEKGS